MAKEKKMDCAILGLLAHQSLTGYEIKKWMDQALRHFWGASYGIIYPTLASLEKEGKVTSVKENEGGRDKIVYSITEKGRVALKEWLKISAAKNEMRFETILKVFFGGEVDKNISIAHIEAFEEESRKELEELLELEKVLIPLQDDTDHLYYLLTLRFGVRTYEQHIAWCQDAKRILAKQK